MISNVSGLTVMEGQKEEIRMVNGEALNFKYPAFVADSHIHRG